MNKVGKEIIDSYNGLSVSKYMQIRELAKQDMDDMQMQAEIIGILCDCDVDEVMNMPLPKYSECVRKSMFLTDKPKAKAECPKHIVLNEKKYYVIRKVEELTAAQYIDYQTYMKMPDPDSKLAEILSIFIIPEGKKYTEGYDVVEVINEIKEYLPISVAFNICFFFRKKQIKSIKHTLIYLGLMMKIWKRMVKTEEQKQMMKEAEMKMKTLQGFLTNGVGYLM